MSNTNWYQKTREETLALLATRVDYGLDQAEVKQRQQRFSNQLQTMTRSNPVKILINQFTDTMVLVLLAATVVSGLIGAMADAVTIMAIVIINAILGFIQEYRAERSLEAIKKLSAPSARVLRQGHKISVPASELVPGDIVFLETGDRVPADIRLLETTGLESDESLLTGESVPVYKEAQQLYDRETSLAEQANMLFMGTSVTRGRGSGVIVNTGMDTVMGQIARMVQEETQQMTPMQIKLDQLGKYLIIICIAVCIVVSLMGIFRGEAIMTMLMAGISLAVAAIPEGLPAIVTVVLALGVQRMADKNAIVRRLSAVETLGCTTVICSDKTGTLTQNKMTVVKMASMDAVLRLDTNSKNKRWLNVHGNKYCDPLQKPGTRWLMDIALNCNNAAREKKGQKWVYNGDPTEIALLEMAHYNGLSQTYERTGEIPFDSERKKMSVLVQKEGQQVLLVKGALEVLISSCTAVIKEDKITCLDNSDQKKIQEIQTEWAAEGLRVLGFAFKILPAAGKGITIGVEMEQELVLCGIIGLLDPPRPGVAEAVRQCRKARIVPIMITGDHPVTAGAIARQIGLADGGNVIAGSQIDAMNDEELADKALSERVFARVSPQHKNRIVKALRKRGQVVAMTGDGVNDAPALKAADIGVAMGISGTEVSREAASMVLADDNFSTIVMAVHEGRAIYDNIRKFIRYLLGCNIGEVLVMFLASLLAMPMPLMPIQILWVNLITDGLPAMALGVEPPEPGIMERQPRLKSEGIFARGLGWTVCGRGLYIALATLTVFTIGLIYSRWQGISGLETARTMALSTLVFSQLFYVFECRSETHSPFELGFTSNPFLSAAVVCSALMHLAVVYLPVMQNIFGTVNLGLWQWLLIISVSGIKLLWKYMQYTWRRIFVSSFRYGKINA